jgi:hypothetical protein
MRALLNVSMAALSAIACVVIATSAIASQIHAPQ